MESGYMFGEAVLHIGQLRLRAGNLLAQDMLLNRRIEQIFLLQLRLERAITFGLLSLQLHGTDLPFDLKDVFWYAQEVLLSPLQFSLGHKLAALVFTRAGRFFDESPPVIGLGVDEFIDPSLLDNGIGFSAHAGPQKKLDDVFQATGDLIDGVFRPPRTEQPSGDQNFPQ